MNVALLDLAARLADPQARVEAAAALARAFGVRHLLIFVRDDDLDLLLPAPGFPQTLPDGKAWRAFVEEAARQGQAHGTLRTERDGDAQPASGFAAGPDVVMVLVGITALSTDTIAWFRALLPLVAVALRAEHTAEVATAEARSAAETAQRAALLATTLDRTRHRLEQALADAHAAHAALEKANAQLVAQARVLEDARAAAELANRAKSEFLATMSHELRTPLNAIAGHIQLLQLGLHGEVSPEQRNALERVDRSQRHLLGLINNILNLSRIEAGRVDYRLTNVVLADALQGITPMIEPQLAGKNLVLQIREDCNVVALADTEKLEQILLNLLSNAVKFTEPGGRVWVGCRYDASRTHVHIEVGDTGIGIPEEKLGHIFEPFTQVDTSHRRTGHGAGLGLAISRDLARGMGGELSVKSTLGRGSVFTIVLPTPPARAEQRLSSGSPAQDPAASAVRDQQQ